MASEVLKYEFKHGGQTDSAGYDSNYHDYTRFMDDSDNVKFTFGLDDIPPTEEEGQRYIMGMEGGESDRLDSSGVTKSLAADFIGSEELYTYIKHWLIDHEYCTINTIIVKITDTLCSKELGLWEMTASDVKWCDEDCNVTFVLNEYKPELNCLDQTLISDNHRGWFPELGSTWGSVDPITGLPLLPYLHPIYRYCDEIKPQAWSNFIFVFAQAVIGFFVSVVSIIVLIDSVFGGDLQDELEEKISNFLQVYLGCNRMHPSPFIHTYFENACSKCKTESGERIVFESDIFNAPAGDIGQHFYNTTMTFAPAWEGLKEEQQVQDLLKGWIDINRPAITAIDLAYMLRPMFNGKFKLEGNKFIFNHKHSFPVEIVLELQSGGAHHNSMLRPLCWQVRDPKIEASLLVRYGSDDKDLSGNNAKHRFDGVVDWTAGFSEQNKKMFEGLRKIDMKDFSTTRYASDGITQELAFNFQFGALDLVLSWTENAMLLSSDYTSLYKLQIYDPSSPMNEAAPQKVDLEDYGPISQWSNDWYVENGGSANTYYMYNTALAFSKAHSDNGHFNLYDLHKMDNPTLSGVKKREWDTELELCCAILDKLIAVNADGLVAKVDYVVQLEDDLQGVLKSVTLDYKTRKIAVTGTTKYV